MTVDPDFASRAEVIHATLGASADQIQLGSFTLASLSPVTTSKVTKEGQPPFAIHRFSFELKDGSDSDWVVACDVHMKWISPKADDSVQELVCSMIDSSGEGGLPYHLSVTGLGPVLGLKTGSLSLNAQILDIASAHADAAPPRQVGKRLGFEISHANRILGSVQTVNPVTIWIDRRGPEHLRSLAAACAVALAFYEHMANDA